MESQCKVPHENSILWKLYQRQFSGVEKHPRTRKQSYYFPCDSFKVKLEHLLRDHPCDRGHVFLGFTRDGHFLLSYDCEVKYELDFILSMRYEYRLFWWEFQFSKPLKKHREVQLFANQCISSELHIFVCQPPDSSYLVVHGTTHFNRIPGDQSTEMSYVSLLQEGNQPDVYLHHELFSPHPPFIPSVALKLNNVLLLNTGDMLIAVSFGQDCYCGETNSASHSVSHIQQGYIIDSHSHDSLLTSSPFDCTTTVMPCSVISNGCEMKLAYEHRCFKQNKGEKTSDMFLISQAQFYAENFIRGELSEDYVSMKDYDLQLIEVCSSTNDVIFMLNALLVLKKDTVCNGETLSSSRRQILALHTIGYIISWNVYTGKVTILEDQPLTEVPGSVCKPRMFSSSLRDIATLRMRWDIPHSKHSSVYTLSNQNTYTNTSLEHLCHPTLPITIVF